MRADRLEDAKHTGSAMQMAIENNYLRRFWISFKG